MKKIKLEDNLKAEFKLKSLTVTKVAKACHIPQSVLHGWLHGTLPSAKNIHHIKTLCDYLNISIDKILFGRDTKNKIVMFESTFNDGDEQYRLTVEKMD